MLAVATFLVERLSPCRDARAASGGSGDDDEQRARRKPSYEKKNRA